MSPPQPPRVDDLIIEIASVSSSLGALIGRSPATPPEENEVWLIYARTERIVAKLKYRLGTERPGVFSEVPTSERPEEFLSKALQHLREARAKIESEKPVDGLEALRSARTYLRAYLSELRRVRMREKRKATISRRSSFPSSSP
ncbi:MAG: hypothetical protein OK474_09035 [Thaumarchaeota archaeon]|nr:hypothetical protein [Nitrososphaerota archaeon]